MNNVDFNLIHKVTLRRKIHILLALILGLCFCNTALAQDGTYLLSKHSPGLDQQNEYYGAAINNDGVLYIASRNGIIRFDGSHSGMINSGGSVFDVEISESGEIYLGGVNGLGRIDPNNNYLLTELMTVASPVHQVYISSQGVYGVADNAIYYYNIDNDTTVLIQDEFAGALYQIVELDDMIFINSENKGLLEIVDNELSSDTPANIASKEVIHATANADKSKHVVIDAYGDVFIYEDGTYKEIPIDKTKYGTPDFVNAIWYDTDLLAIGTLTEGVFMVNSLSGEVQHEISYQTGLDDNEVRALLLDKNGGILLLNRQSLALLSPNIPIMSFSHYQGLDGELMVSAFINNQLLVGTNLGLFSLEKIEDFREVVSYRRRVIPVASKSSANTKKARKGLFGFKKKKQKPQPEAEDAQPKISIQKTVEKELLATYYAFKPVDSILTHVNQILELGNQTIASGLSGVYTYGNGRVDKISDEPIRYSYVSNDKSKLFACTDDRVLVYFNHNDRWVFRDVFTDLRAQVVHILEHEDRYWLCSPEKVYKIEIDGAELIDAAEYEVYNPYYSDLFAFDNGKGISFVGNSGMYQLRNNEIQLVDTANTIVNVILDNNNRVWQQNSNGWELLGREKKGYPVFKAFTNLRHIYHSESSGAFTVIADNNRLLKFNDNIQAPTSRYIPRLDEIKLISDKILDIGDFEIQQEESSLSFRITHSDLSQLYNTEYRYQLNGFEDDWSAWSKDNVVHFSFLPPGDYNLSLEGRNAFGQLYAIPSINFSVLPPYWLRPWFYAFEVCVIILLLFISIKLKSWGFKYRLLSRLLAFLTLVIILEYLEAIVEHYFAFENSPIFSFALQVTMALIILPFEGLLKKYIFKEKVELSEYVSIKEEQKINTKKEE